MVERIQIRVDLDGDLAKKFQAIKAKLGLKSNAEVVRHLITVKHEQLEQK